MSFYRVEIDEVFKDIGEEVTLKLFRNNANWRISVFLAHTKTNQDLEKYWEAISNSIAAIYQSVLVKKEDEFERWNIYVVFLSKENVEKELKFKIENDKFSSRKIVHSRPEENLEDDLALRIIIEQITNEDLQLVDSTQEAGTTNRSYTPKTMIWDLIKNEDLLHYKKDKQQLLLDTLIKKIGDENKKS